MADNITYLDDFDNILKSPSDPTLEMPKEKMGSIAINQFSALATLSPETQHDEE